jgi:peroxiredoxin Q/BCP
MARLRFRRTLETVSAYAVGIVRTVFGRHIAMSELKIGDAAPDFELPGSDGSVYRLRDFAGRQMVVLAWFPKAFTGG